MNFQELKKLSNAIVSDKTYTITFSKDDGTTEEMTLTKEAMNSTLRKELNKLFSEKATNFERYKLDFFDLIQEAVDIKLPKEVNQWFEGFVQNRTYGEKDKPLITLHKMKRYLRERATITQVANAGVYETFKLPSDGAVTPTMMAIGGAAQISIEDFLTERVDWDALIEIIGLGIADRIYDEIIKALETLEARLPANNKASSADFEPEAAEKVIDTVSAYGDPVIFCTKAFARAITDGSDWASEDEKKARRERGYLANYKDARIVIMPQTFVDENNEVKKLDDSKAWVLPSSTEMPIQVCYQGDLRVRDFDNMDWTKEIQAYKKVAVLLLAGNEVGVIEITSLASE